MKTIHIYELKKYLTKKLNNIYIFLGEDDSLLQKNQDIILKHAYKKGFLQTIKIDVEKDQDWEKVIIVYKTENLFFQKIVLVINCLINKINVLLIKRVKEIFSLLNADILTIFKINHLSGKIEKKKFLINFKMKII